MNLNEATSTDLKVIDELQKLGWKPGDTLLLDKYRLFKTGERGVIIINPFKEEFQEIYSLG